MIYFTADFHLGDETLIQLGNRQFKSGMRMSEVLIKNANARAKSTDTLIHAGDFVAYGNDHGIASSRISGEKWLEKINAKTILLEGNHDPNNHVKTDCNFMFVNIGKLRNISVSHYPSWYDENKYIFRSLTFPQIHLCGHVHGAWKWKIVKNVLNINVGVDVWNYQVVSGQDILNLISNINKGQNNA